MPARCFRAFVLALALGGAVGASGQLVLHLTFDNAAALTSDSSGNNIAPGLIQGSITQGSGVSGGAGVFDGSAYLRWVSGSSSITSLAGSFTISVWVKTTQVYGSAGDRGYEGVGIVYADQPGQSTDTIPIALNGSVAGFMTSDGQQDTTIHSTSPISTGSFVHVAATYDHATGIKRLYVNGSQQATETVVPTSHNARGFLVLGANDFDSRYFSGLLDDFQFYTKPLNAAEVAYLYNNPGLTAVPEPGTVTLLGAGFVLVALTALRRRRA